MLVINSWGCFWLALGATCIVGIIATAIKEMYCISKIGKGLSDFLNKKEEE